MKKNISEENKLQLITWIITDGALIRNNVNVVDGKRTYSIKFNLSKEDKIFNLTALLNKMQIPFTTYKNKKVYGYTKKPTTQFYIGVKDATYIAREFLYHIKEFPKSFEKLSLKSLSIVLNTLAITDGKRMSAKCIYWRSTNENNIAIISKACKEQGIGFKSTSYDMNLKISLGHLPVYTNKILLNA